MAIRNILKEGDPVLSKKSKIVTDFNEKLHTLLDDMKETMQDSNGVGLAAVQVGILKRVIVILDQDEKIIELINPQILQTEDSYDDTEGCLSVPGIFGIVERPVKTVVSAQNRYGEKFKIIGYDLTSRALCHEIEHLDGHLFRERVKDYIEV